MLHEQTTAPALNGMEHRKSSGYADFGAGSWLFLRARSQPDLNAAAAFEGGGSSSSSSGSGGSGSGSGSSSPYSPAKAQAHAQMAIDCIRKVIVNGQCAIVVIFPLAVLWVTEDSHIPLGVPTDLDNMTLALEQKVSSEDSIELAERILRSARCAELGIAMNSTWQTGGYLKSQNYKVDIDCYFKDPDLHCAIALLTPGAQSPEAAELRYEQAQLSSVRYHIGIISNSSTDSEHPNNGGMNGQSYSRSPQEPDYATTAGSRSAAGPKDRRESVDMASITSTQHMHDFIPSMTCREVEYFYSLLPGSASGSYMHHEHEAANSTSIMEQEEQITDPDHLDPHQRLRLLQSVPTVLPRRPRDLAEVQAEAAVAAQRGSESRYLGGGAGFAGYHTSIPAPPPGPVYKKSGIKCLECGVDQSPEWRKGPMGPKTLCNRCGLRYAKKLRLQSK